jgi:uncharacterized caspase-like protein
MAKYALCIGINDYPGTQNDLSGCVNDATDWYQELEKRGFKVSSLLNSKATKSNVVEAMTKIVADTGSKDISVITYSGHGTWVPDDEGDEADGRDEALCPYDITKGKVLDDDEIFDIFSQRNRGARIVMISDSCHSGSVAKMSLEMPNIVKKPAQIRKVRFLNPSYYLKNDRAIQAAKRVENTKAKGPIRDAVVLLAACKDDEYSYDAEFNGRPNGAFTYAALNTLRSLSADADYLAWYKEIRKCLPNVQYPQSPALSCSAAQRKWKVFAE